MVGDKLSFEVLAVSIERLNGLENVAGTASAWCVCVAAGGPHPAVPVEVGPEGAGLEAVGREQLQVIRCYLIFSRLYGGCMVVLKVPSHHLQDVRRRHRPAAATRGQPAKPPAASACLHVAQGATQVELHVDR